MYSTAEVTVHVVSLNKEDVYFVSYILSWLGLMPVLALM